MASPMTAYWEQLKTTKLCEARCLSGTNRFSRNVRLSFLSFRLFFILAKGHSEPPGKVYSYVELLSWSNLTGSEFPFPALLFPLPSRREVPRPSLE